MQRTSVCSLRCKDERLPRLEFNLLVYFKDLSIKNKSNSGVFQE